MTVNLNEKIPQFLAKNAYRIFGRTLKKYVLNNPAYTRIEVNTFWESCLFCRIALYLFG
jgi:hypothetical protein